MIARFGSASRRDALQRLPYRRRIVAERNGAELGDEVGVANSVRVDQVASFAAHECLVQTEALVEESLVRRDVSYVGILLLRAPILHRRKCNHLVVEKGSAARVCRWARGGIVLRSRRLCRREPAALAQVLRQHRTLLRARELHPIPHWTSGASFRRENAQVAVHFLLAQFVDALEEVRSIRSAQRRARLSAGDHPVARSLGVRRGECRRASAPQRASTNALMLLSLCMNFASGTFMPSSVLMRLRTSTAIEGIEAEIEQRLLGIDARGRGSHCPRQIDRGYTPPATTEAPPRLLRGCHAHPSSRSSDPFSAPASPPRPE